MKNICTLSDINYLLYGITLYESLKSTTENFVLHYLCLDSENYNSLVRLECESLKIYHIDWPGDIQSLERKLDAHYQSYQS